MNAIYRKELSVYFHSFIGYFFLFVLVGFTAWLFMLSCIMSSSPNYYNVLAGMSIVFLILIPTLTMRLFAEEARQKTDQLLYTAPVTIAEIVLGKFFAAATLFLIGMGITILFPISLSFFGTLPTAQIMSAYIGYILMGGCFIAVGMLISIFTDNQIISAVATFSILLLFFFLQGMLPNLPTGVTYSVGFAAILILIVLYILYDGTKNIPLTAIVAVVAFVALAIAYFVKPTIFDGFIFNTLSWLSILTRFDNFNKGILNVSDIIYYMSFMALCLYLTMNTIEKRRWK